MGIASSRPYTEVEDEFKQSVLLVNAPATLFGVSMAAGQWSVLRGVCLNVVRWGGEAVNAERHRQTVGRHEHIVYFVDPCDVTTEEVSQRLSTVMLPIVSNAANKATRVQVVTYGFDRDDEACPQARIHVPACLSAVFGPPDAAPRGGSKLKREPVPAAPAGDYPVSRMTYSHLASADDLTTVLSHAALAVLPRKLSRPLGNLIRDFAGTCGASEVALLEAQSLLPLVFHAAGEEDEVLGAARLAEHIAVLRDGLLAFRGEGVKGSSVQMHVPAGDVWVSWAAPPWALMLVVIPAGAEIVGDALVEINMRHYAVHISNVVRNTTERTSFTAILPPE